MTEGNVVVPTEAPPTPETAPLIDTDGNLREGWTSILEEDLRANQFLNESKTLQGMAKSVVSARSMVGKDKIPVPTEASSQEDWDTYHKAGGRPETAADYNLTRPEEIPEESYSQERADKYMELFHKLGLSKKQVDMLWTVHHAEIAAELKSQASETELSETELKNGLYSDWGNAYEQKKHMGNIAIEKGTAKESPEFKQRIVDKYGSDPDLVRLLSNLGSNFIESTSPDPVMIPTPGDIQARITEAQANPAYKADYAEHGFTKTQHKNQVNVVQRLFNEKMTSQVKTG